MRLVTLALVLSLAGCASAGDTMERATRGVSQAGQPRPATNPASQTVRTTKRAAEDAPSTASQSASSAAHGARPSATETIRRALPD